jgi:hypothetical protein
MFDDQISLIMFLILYTLFIFYLNYLQNLGIVKNDVDNLTCNPLTLILDSVSNSDSGSKRFEGCVKKIK